MGSNSADAGPQTNVPVPAPFALKLNPGSEQVPEAHVNGSPVAWGVVPPKRRAAPWAMYPCPARPEGGAPGALLTLTGARPPRPPLSKGCGGRDTLARRAGGA